MATDVMRNLIAVAALMIVPRIGDAQCPDGTEPRQGECYGQSLRRSIDPQRLAIPPFNTSGVRPSLAHIGSGLAELLTFRFSGDFGPEAVDAGESHIAWNRAGGARGPLTQQNALRIARDLGAGQAVLGSIVEAGNKLIVSASLVSTNNAAARPERVEVEGTAEDLGALTETLAARLQGRAAGIQGNHPTEALRAFFDGMAAYRRWDMRLADSLLVLAAKLDSTFIEAAYRATMHRARWGPMLGVAPYAPGFRHLWRNRSTLSADKRALLTAVHDSARPGIARRPLLLQRMERTIAKVPNSADAWTLLGDGYLLVGRVTSIEDWKGRARHAYLTALRLDPAARKVIAPNLKDLAFLERNAREFALYADTFPADRYRAAVLSGNAVRINATRTRYAESLRWSFDGGGKPFWLSGSPLPQHEVDSILLDFAPLATSPVRRCLLARSVHEVSRHAGRPARADSALSDTFRVCDRPPNAPPLDTANERIHATLNFAINDLAAEAEFESWRARGSDPMRPPVSAMFSRLRRGDTTGAGWFIANRPPFAPPDRGVEEIIATLPPGNQGAAVVSVYQLTGIMNSFGRSDGTALHKADSLTRILPRDNNDMENYDLALAFARRGEYKQAIAAARRRVMFIGTWSLYRHVPQLRLEGQWATIVGDTAGAIRAYREYLLFRESPEPILVPQRDSVIAELAALTRPARRGVPADTKQPPPASKKPPKG